MGSSGGTGLLSRQRTTFHQSTLDHNNCALLRTPCHSSPQACYPEALAPAISFPPKLADVKKQVHLGAPEVWGACAGAEVYKRYSRCGTVCIWLVLGGRGMHLGGVEILPPCNLTCFPVSTPHPSACNYTTQVGCVTSSEGCHWISAYTVSCPGRLRGTKRQSCPTCHLPSTTPPTALINH